MPADVVPGEDSPPGLQTASCLLAVSSHDGEREGGWKRERPRS